MAKSTKAAKAKAKPAQDKFGVEYPNQIKPDTPCKMCSFTAEKVREMIGQDHAPCLHSLGDDPHAKCMWTELRERFAAYYRKQAAENH